MRFQEHLPSSAGAARTCYCSCAASPAGKQGTAATTIAGSHTSFPLPVPLALQHPSDTYRTQIHRASKGQSRITSQPSFSSDQGPLLCYLTHNHTEVYSKRSVVMLKIKLGNTCFHSTLPHMQAPIKQTGWHLSGPMSHSHVRGHFAALLPLLELHSA